jgi:hypothetical protein
MSIVGEESRIITSNNICLETMNFIKSCKLNIWNVSNMKNPINKGVGIIGWNNYDVESFNRLDVDYTKNIGFLSGFQYNTKKYIIVLDFDIYNKEGKDSNVEKLYLDFLNKDISLNITKLGHFKSSTCGNKGVIIDITEDEDLISKLEELKVSKIGKGLEILIRNNVVLPPSNTKCKRCGECIHERIFIEDIGINKIHKDTSKFIIDYVNTFKSKKPTKHDIRDTKNATKGIIYYNTLINEENDDAVPSFSCILKLVKLCLKNVLNNYQGWFFITASLINSYGNSDINFEEYNKICIISNNYDYDENLKMWKSTDVNKYKCYNYKAIIKASNMYNELLSYSILGEDYKRREKELEEIENNKDYDKWKIEFETCHAKISDPINYLVDKGESPYFVSERELIEKYREHKEYIAKWLIDKNKRKYKSIIFNPSASIIENNENYNLFTGYRAEKLPLVEEKLDISLFIKLLYIFSGNIDIDNINRNNTSFKLVLAWLVNIIKYKKQTKIAIICRSVREQGVGKGTFYTLMKAMMGDKYCAETANIDDIFGNYNDIRTNKILIVGDECSGTNSFKYNGKIKNAITEASIRINGKYNKMFDIANSNNFLFYSNSEQPIKVEQGNRRFWCVDVPVLSNKTKFFSNIYNMIKNDKYIRFFYDYIVNELELDFDLNVMEMNLEEIIKYSENISTKNLKQINPKDLYFRDIYRIINKHEYKEDDLEIKVLSNLLDNIIINEDYKDCIIIKRSIIFDYYVKYCVSCKFKCEESNQNFNKSLLFYNNFVCQKRNNLTGIVCVFDMYKLEEWYLSKGFNEEVEEM